MGQKNNVMCNYLSSPAVFADFVNGSIHKGKEVLFPHQLSARETGYYQKETPRPSESRAAKYIERRRDALKMVSNNNCYIVIGIEAQDRINHIMPLKCMEYDVIEYKRQLTDLNRTRKKKLSGDEFLSGMAKDEKLNPVTTIVFYHGEDPYDGCTSLHGMLELNGENKAYEHFIADYHINLVRVEDLDETLFRTGLRELIGFLKHRNSKEGMMEGHDLCKALKEWMEDERNAGKEEGWKEGQKFGLEKGENRFASLTSVLLSANRMNDLKKAAEDEVFRNSLYQEYAL